MRRSVTLYDDPTTASVGAFDDLDELLEESSKDRITTEAA